MKKKVLLLLLLTVILFGAFADDYYVKSLSVDITLNRNAVLDVKEDYVFDFVLPHHGVYRDIPYRYDNVKAVVSDIECSQPFSTEKEEGILMIKAGSSSETYLGNWPMSLSYRYDFGQDRNEGWDELYYNIVSDAQVTYDNIDFTITIPDIVDSSDIWVTAGYYGSTDQGQYTVEYKNGKTVITGNVKGLRDNCSITVFVQFPDQWYQGAREMWDFRDTFKVLNVVISLALLALSAFVWILCGRDNVPIVSAKFNPPDNYSPLVVGYLADGTVDDKDITSMLYFWADKGYVRINEVKKDKFSFTKLEEISSDAPEYEQFLFKNFFRGADKEGTVDLDDLQRTNFYETMQLTKVKVCKNFKKDKRLYEPKSVFFSVLFTVLALVPYLTLAFSVGLCEVTPDEVFAFAPLAIVFTAMSALLFAVLFRKWYIRKTNIPMILVSCIPTLFGLFLSTAISAACRGYAYLPGVAVSVLSSTFTVLFASIMTKRTKYGDKLLEDTLGFREFIDKVSLGELTTLIDEDPMYYYHNLSYAIVLGLEDKWAKKFECLSVAPPMWYRGSSPFDVYFYSRMASRMTNQIRQNSMPKTAGNSNTGSFHMGGFAGGGFGGGSVHAW